MIDAVVCLDAELQKLANTRVTTDVTSGGYCGLVCSREDVFQWDIPFRFSTSGMLQHVNEVKFIPRLELGEIDDDVVTLGDCMSGQNPIFCSGAAVKVNRVFHDVAVVGDHVERDSGPVLIHQGDLDVTGD